MAVAYHKLCKPDTFIGQYMAMMDNQETAYAYDFFCALWLLSLALRRECFVDRPRAPVYMNMYAILVAKSGVTRKSTAVRSAMEVAQALFAVDTRAITVINGKTTPSQFEALLNTQTKGHKTSHAALAISELVTLLGREQHSMAMPGLLTDLYDAQAERRTAGTLTGGAMLLRNVFVSLLGASTPSWLIRQINPDVIEGGFTSRCYFIVSETPKRSIAWPDQGTQRGIGEDERCRSGHTALVHTLSELSGRSRAVGGIRPNSTALSYFDRWYRTRVHSTDEFRASFESREDAHVLRIAGFLCVNDNSWQISVPHLQTAIRIVDELKEKASQLFALSITTGKVAQGIVQLRELLIAAGTEAIQQRELTIKLRNKLTGAELCAALEIMHELGMVARFTPVISGRRGAPATYWRAASSLLASGATVSVTERMGA